MTAGSRERKLMLVDVSSLVYRAFFALPPLSTSKGQPVSALYGFDRMLNKALAGERPTHAVACFDAGVPAHRVEVMPAYKATRPEMPDPLRSQFPLVRELLGELGIATVEVEGEEADDCIATLATRASSERFDSVVLSGDLDLLQLVDDHCTIVVTRRGVSDLVRYDVAAVRERYGIMPRQLPDYRGLKGDPSDNLPGVPGIGEKTAAKLIAEYGSLDELLDNVDSVTPKRIAELLKQYGDQARRCREVSMAKRDLDIVLDWRDGEYHPPDPSILKALYERFEFRSLLRDAAAQPHNADQSIANASGPATRAARAAPSAPNQAPSPAAIPIKYAVAGTSDDALRVFARAADSQTIAVATVPEVESWRDAQSRHFAIAFEPGDAAIVAAHLFRGGPVRAALDSILAADAPQKIVHDAKNLAGWLAAGDRSLGGVAFDTMIAHGLIDPARGEMTLADLSQLRGVDGAPAEEPQKSLELFEDGQAMRPEQAAAADAVIRLGRGLEGEIDAAQLRTLYYEVELPLAAVLADMERVGFRLDREALSEIRLDLDAAIARLTAEIHGLAGEEFNINSPRALASVLFEKLQLPSGTKTKTGFSTGIDVLAPLAPVHAIAAKVLEFREVTKLKSTYVDALPASIDPQTGRLHTTLHQLGAATGRLASTNPNLQNIPIRSEVGRTIRRAFLPPTPGNVLLAADYSQIELRLMAHFSEDPAMIAAFESDEDIHAFAARAVFGIPAEQPVPAEMRRRAKAVNFGILYGMGPHGLAQSVGFSRAEAKDFIAAYFARFPRVRQYIDRTLEEARSRGYVTTLMGRRRYLPDLASPNHMLRAAAERMATNAPLQGSVADLIKLAMVRIARRFRELETPAQLILQVHDELIIDASPAHVDMIRREVRSAMEGTAALRVPLVVDFKVGPNWGALE